MIFLNNDFYRSIDRHVNLKSGIFTKIMFFFLLFR